MQPQSSSVYNSKPIWTIGFTNQLPSSNIFRFQTCHYGGILESNPGVIILEPDQHGLEFLIDQIHFYKGRLQGVPILIYSSRSDEASVFALIKAGVNGYLLKDTNQNLDGALQSVLAGGMPLSPEISAILVESTRNLLPSEVESFDLNAREIELLQLMSEGKTKKQISDLNGRSIHTIDNHVRKIYLKMKVNNLGEAVGNAFRAGLIY